MSILKKIVVAILILESRIILRKYKPFIVAVTGSVGKTSTKDAIFSVLKSPMVCNDQKMCYVRKSEKSMNSEIGLPLSIIGAPNAWHSLSGWLKNIVAGLKLIVHRADYPDCLVLEVGADHPGDIRRVAHWLRPDIAVITKISRTPVHVEFFDSPEQVFEEKMSLAEEVKDKGIVVLFGDDEKTLSIGKILEDQESAKKNPKKRKQRSVITYGLSEAMNIRGTDYKVDYEEVNGIKSAVGFSFNLDMRSRVVPISIKGALGTPYVYSFLAAAAVGQARGVSEETIAKSLHEYDVTPGRMNVISGINDSTLIDDTYNSSPDATVAALEALKGIENSGTKIAILGDMMELGKHAGDEHRNIGKEAASVVGRLITVGQRSRLTAEEAVKNGLSGNAVNSFDTAEQAAEFVTPLIKKGDAVLVKGSQSMRMEKVTKALLREPDRAGDLLVRQEREWLKKD